MYDYLKKKIYHRLLEFNSTTNQTSTQGSVLNNTSDQGNVSLEKTLVNSNIIDYTEHYDENKNIVVSVVFNHDNSINIDYFIKSFKKDKEILIEKDKEKIFITKTFYDPKEINNWKNSIVNFLSRYYYKDL